jgi:AraC-like DNA-binding protein
LKLNDDGIFGRRKTENSSGDLHFFEDEFEVKDVLSANVITCFGWLLEFVELKSGELFFQTGEEIVRPDYTQIGIFYPPFTFTKPCFKNAKGNVRGVVGINTLTSTVKVPIVFKINIPKTLKTVADVEKFLASIQHFQIVEANPKASLISVKTKKIVDENYRIYPSIAKIAKLLDVSHAHLTRQFKHDFGLSPNKYLHHLRIADATFRLSQGEEIINVSNDVGYNDLSRFYKQFRKSTQHSPKRCQVKN